MPSADKPSAMSIGPGKEGPSKMDKRERLLKRAHILIRIGETNQDIMRLERSNPAGLPSRETYMRIYALEHDVDKLTRALEAIR
jgi:hypothetical protein